MLISILTNKSYAGTMCNPEAQREVPCQQWLLPVQGTVHQLLDLEHPFEALIQTPSNLTPVI